MREHRRSSPLSIVCLMAVAVFLSGCEGGPLGADYLSAPAGAGPMDFGSLIRVEPGDEFEVTLAANGAFPDEPWQAVEYDDAVIEPTGSEHEVAVRGPAIGMPGKARTFPSPAVSSP